MEPWEEALDVDDSDLHPPTLLRRCNQQRCSNQTNSITTTTAAAYISQSQTLDSITATTHISQSQTLDSSPSLSQSVHSLPRNLTSVSPAEPPPQSHTIPGPAGIVQAAKLRKILNNANRLGQEEHPMATQEYIRKVVEDPEEDEDFKRNPWLSAIEFHYADGMFDSASNGHLGEINKVQKNGKLDQVVAVIKSCTPNELGDMMVALKDPTGTVSGTIHHKVLTEGDFRKGICVGSVLILNKVSVFSPSRSTHYLNITKKNLVKVFYKDGGSSQIQTNHRPIDATPHYGPIDAATVPDSAHRTPTLGSAFSFDRGAEGITTRMKRSKNMNNERENISYSKTSNKGTHMQIARDNETSKEANVTETEIWLLLDGIYPLSTSNNNSTHLSSQDFARGTPKSGSAFSFERGAEGITNRMKRSKNVNDEQENINNSKTSNEGTNLQIARDKETLKEAHVIETGGIFPYSKSNNNSTHLSSQDSAQGTPTLSSAFSLERGTEGITNRMKRSKTNNEQENIDFSNTSNIATNMKVTRDKDTLKKADVTQKGVNVGQLSEGSTKGFNEIKALLPDWTEDQLLELCLE